MVNQSDGTLDKTYERLQSGSDVDGLLSGLVEDLYKRRTATAQGEWQEWIQSGFRRHPLYQLLLEDPFVRHSAVRPRGYPGDAELLDYIYGSQNVRPMIETASPVGRRLYEWDRTTPAPSAVRNRLRMAAAEVDRMASTGKFPHVLSIACGHLREAQYLESLNSGTLGRFVALDQDTQSLALVDNEWGSRGIEARQCDAKMLIKGGMAGLGKFDFIYTLGLFDYVPDTCARRMVKTMVEMLNPGGKLWIANFIEDLWSAGYMETVMDWWLIYRSEDRLNDMARSVPVQAIASRQTFREPKDNVAFLEIVRA